MKHRRPARVPSSLLLNGMSVAGPAGAWHCAAVEVKPKGKVAQPREPYLFLFLHTQSLDCRSRLLSLAAAKARLIPSVLR